MTTTAPRALREKEPKQANLAAENQRLRAALAEATRHLAERDEQAVATAEILRVISRTPADASSVLDSIVRTVAALCDAGDVLVARAEGGTFRIAASHGPLAAELRALVVELTGAPVFRLTRGLTIGRAIVDGQVVRVEDLGTDPDFPDVKIFVERTGVRSSLGVPLLRDGAALGSIAVYRREVRPFTDRQAALLQTFADQVVIALENARLFSELQESNATLKEALEQQTATAEVLRAIASSPADRQRVLDAICASAAQLSGTDDAHMHLNEPGGVRHVAGYGSLAEREVGHFSRVDWRAWTVAGPHPAVMAQAQVERRPIHVHDFQAVADDYPSMRFTRELGVRTMVAVPLLREDEAIGDLYLRKLRIEPFTEQQIALLQTFADQAVIAIENARLFAELNESNATLKEALERQTALSDVLGVIAAAATDLPAVMRTILERAVRLCGASDATVRLIEGGDEVVLATTGTAYAHRLVVGTRRPLSAVAHLEAARAVTEQRTCYHADTRVSDEPYMAERGILSQLYVPLPGEGAPLGFFTIRATETNAFSPSQIALVETFARQASIAVQNARLLGELRERDERRRQELERAAAIQQRLLPERVEGWPGVLEIAHRFRPAVETSGDFYDVLPLPAHKGALEPLQIAVGDVAGKGMSAALVTALARSALQLSATVPTGMATPATTLRIAGQRLHRDVGASHFVACALAVVEPPGRQNAGPLLRLANAAQVPVLLVRGGSATEVEPPGYRLPLGAEDDGAYEDARAELRPGDVVVFSSDGLVEAPSLPTTITPEHLPPPPKPGELFGFARLAASATHWSQRTPTAGGVAAGIWSDLTAWCGDESHHDDMTLLVLRVPEPSA